MRGDKRRRKAGRGGFAGGRWQCQQSAETTTPSAQQRGTTSPLVSVGLTVPLEPAVPDVPAKYRKSGIKKR